MNERMEDIRLTNDSLRGMVNKIRSSCMANSGEHQYLNINTGLSSHLGYGYVDLVIIRGNGRVVKTTIMYYSKGSALSELGGIGFNSTESFDIAIVNGFIHVGVALGKYCRIFVSGENDNAETAYVKGFSYSKPDASMAVDITSIGG